MIKKGTDTVKAAEKVKEDAEEEEWLPEDVVASGSAANK